ncbi:MAG: nitrate ABC transporter substrate-binding protein, partial [Roseinatronobacter sp.]
MSNKSLGNPFSHKTDLRHGAGCGCETCSSDARAKIAAPMTSEAMLERAIESAVVRSVFGHNDISRRSMMGMLGGGAFAAALASVFPMDQAKALILDELGPPEKPDLKVG